MGATGNRVGVNASRGFESRPLRHIHIVKPRRNGRFLLKSSRKRPLLCPKKSRKIHGHPPKLWYSNGIVRARPHHFEKQAQCPFRGFRSVSSENGHLLGRRRPQSPGREIWGQILVPTSYHRPEAKEPGPRWLSNCFAGGSPQSCFAQRQDDPGGSRPVGGKA